ncbi:AEC family transporter [Microbacterium sp. NPDC055683]
MTSQIGGLLTGYGAVAAILFLGYACRRWGLLPDGAERTLNTLTLTVTTPCLYIAILGGSDRSVLLSPFALASLLSLIVAATVVLLIVLVVRRRLRMRVRETAMIVGTSVYTNVGNIGIPIAVSVLGSTDRIAPMILLQVLVVTPVLLMVLETTSAVPGPRWRALARPFANPIIVAAVVGGVLLAADADVPSPVLAPFEMVGDAAVPIMLIAFGMSLAEPGSAPGDAGGGSAVWLAAFGKLVILPAVSLSIGLAFGVGGDDLLALVLIAALPTAQNIYVIARAHGVLPSRVRAIVLATTVASLPVALAAVILLT